MPLPRRNSAISTQPLPSGTFTFDQVRSRPWQPADRSFNYRRGPMISPRPNSPFRISPAAFPILLLAVLAIVFMAQVAPAAPSLLYQWDFNGPGTGTTVTPAVYPKSSASDPATGVLTMSQEQLNSDFT